MADLKPCVWTQDRDGIWITDCGESYEYMHGGPKDNGAKYCSYCGKNLDELPYIELIAEEDD